mmetsp:Transcript_15426/g.17277  ORF Transcript_15426/g.17277 Transcript_15426/m.17277 type:complete len:277 (+) Transcript_15426:41-871(+)
MWHDYYDSDKEGSIDFTEVRFYRPDGTIEGKDISWCTSNNMFYIKEDLWSGPWYYDHFPEERPKKSPTCPVRGCNKKFKTLEYVDQHIRITNNKSRRKYRRENNIVAGLTVEEEEEKRVRMEERENERVREQRSELLDTIYGGCADPDSYIVAQARRQLQEIDEKNYKFPCPVNNCCRRFETEEDLYHDHLVDNKGPAHKRAKLEFEKRFHYPCPVAYCSRRFEDDFSLCAHLGSMQDSNHKKAYKAFQDGCFSLEHLYEPTDKSQTRMTNYFAKK